MPRKRQTTPAFRSCCDTAFLSTPAIFIFGRPRSAEVYGHVTCALAVSEAGLTFPRRSEATRRQGAQGRHVEEAHAALAAALGR
jgi:hypothetical protein